MSDILDKLSKDIPLEIYSEDNFNTYEQALEEGLQEALKLI